MSEEILDIQEVCEKSKIVSKKKKKRGRPLLNKRRKKYPRKRGPRKKRKKKIEKVPYVTPKQPYRLIITKNKEKVAFIKALPTEEQAYRLFYKALEENKKEVIFPIRFLNYKKIQPVEYELYIIKHKTEEDKNITTTKLRNEYGEFIEHTTDHEDYIVIDKAKWELEESFWIYGYHPTQQRKSFNWILEDFIESTVDNKYYFKNVWVYKNKFIVDCGEGKLKIAFCKNRDDAVRLYNEIEKICVERKYKYVLFSGDIQARGRYFVTKWVKRLMDFTGFNYRKITRHCLRP